MTHRNGIDRLLSRLASAGMLLASTSLAGAAQPSLEALDSIEIPADGASGVRIDELSGLAWDADEQLLYAVSDKGVLHHFRIRLEETRIVEMQPIFSTPLATTTGEPPVRPLTNAEGLAALNGDNGKRSDTELLIALEDGPAIGRYTPQGHRIADVALPGTLADANQYSEENSRLEAVAFDARHGVLTAPEEAMLGQPPERHTLYAADGTTWSFKTFQPHRSNIKAIEAMPDGNVLILERTREEKGGASIARLRYLDLAGCAQGDVCGPAELSASPGAMLEGNFEGLARLSDELFLIVTDKKDAEPTTFVLFKVTAAEQ